MIPVDDIAIGRGDCAQPSLVDGLYAEKYIGAIEKVEGFLTPRLYSPNRSEGEKIFWIYECLVQQRVIHPPTHSHAVVGDVGLGIGKAAPVCLHH